MTPALHTPFLAVPQDVQVFANEQGVAAYLRAWFMHMAGYESGRSAPE